jgi:hypothetical protein
VSSSSESLELSDGSDEMLKCSEQSFLNKDLNASLPKITRIRSCIPLSANKSLKLIEEVKIDKRSETSSDSEILSFVN